MSTASDMISEECSTIALYGIEPTTKAAERFYHSMIAWFDKLTWPADEVVVVSPSHMSERLSVSQANALLQDMRFEDVMAVELVSTAPWAESWDRDYLLLASYDRRRDELYAVFVARSSLATLSPSSLLPIAHFLVTELNPAYGIGYRMEHQHAPELYAIGLNYESDIARGAEYEEELNVSRWGDIGMIDQVYRNGLLREVYPWNFLTPPQLARPVNGIPLELWIQQDVRRGMLNVLGNGVSLWEVPDAEIPHVRDLLCHADVIFDWRKYA